MATGPLPAAPATVKCDLVFAIGADLTALTRFYITYSGSAPTAAELVTFAIAIGTAWDNDLKAYTDDDTTLETVECIDLSSDTSPSGEASIGAVGTLSGAYLPADAAMVITYDQPRRYRGGHARGYWRQGVQADLQSPQEWTSGFVSTMTTQIEAFFAAVLAAGWSGGGSLVQSQVSYFAGFTVVTSPITGRARNIPTKRATPVLNTISGYTPRLRIGSQRRRLGKA
jgi:hypothetical protein